VQAGGRPQPHGCANWTIATYLPFLWRPETHMFLKPQVTWELAVRVGHPLAATYEACLLPVVYRSLLDLAHRTREAIADLDSRDMIDIQSFIWIVGSYQDHHGSFPRTGADRAHGARTEDTRTGRPPLPASSRTDQANFPVGSAERTGGARLPGGLPMPLRLLCYTGPRRGKYIETGMAWFSGRDLEDSPGHSFTTLGRSSSVSRREKLCRRDYSAQAMDARKLGSGHARSAQLSCRPAGETIRVQPESVVLARLRRLLYPSRGSAII